MHLSKYLIALLLCVAYCADGAETLQLNPPTGWRAADETMLTSRVKAMVIGKGRYDYPPSINLATEEFQGTLKDYMKIVKKINASQGSAWKDLGKISTDAGVGSLSQIDIETNWGPVRMMHLILVHSGQAFIVTAAAIKEEFPDFYKDFFNAFISLKITEQRSE
jgi:hypothetical protein